MTADSPTSRVCEQLATALNQSIHDAQEEAMWDNASGVKTIKAA